MNIKETLVDRGYSEDEADKIIAEMVQNVIEGFDLAVTLEEEDLDPTIHDTELKLLVEKQEMESGYSSQHSGIGKMFAERMEQLVLHGISVQQDAQYNTDKQLIVAAHILSGRESLDKESNEEIDALRPEDWNLVRWRHMCKKPYPDRIIIAGALLAAEYDRLMYEEKAANVDED